MVGVGNLPPTPRQLELRSEKASATILTDLLHHVAGATFAGRPHGQREKIRSAASSMGRFGPSCPRVIQHPPRQLRLWHGRRRNTEEPRLTRYTDLECLVDTRCAATNVLLPIGIGQFTIADDAVVEDADLGVNFFLDEPSRGKPRAQCTTEYLLELNPEVTGEWYPKSPVSDYTCGIPLCS